MVTEKKVFVAEGGGEKGAAARGCSAGESADTLVLFRNKVRKEALQGSKDKTGNEGSKPCGRNPF